MKKSLYEFGGSEEQVYNDQKFFLKYFLKCKNALDIGCGRGVFMKMLKDNGVNCIGIDNNNESLKFCENKGLRVYKSDAIQFLANSIDKFDGIFLGQIIEHFNFDQANVLIKYCHNALKNEGVLGLITPNPASFQVISEMFWLDPTHIRPYPIPLLESIFKKHGFKILFAESLVMTTSWRDYLKRFLESLENQRWTGINSYLIVKK